MKLAEFLEQDKYCKENNTPKGKGCDMCPAKDKMHCADALRNSSAKLSANIGKPGFSEMSKKLERDYGLLPWNQLALIRGWIEFPQ